MVCSFSYDGGVVCEYSCMLTPPGHWITTSRPIGSGNGATIMSAPSASAVRTAASRSTTRYPVRSPPKGKGIGDLNPNMDKVPTGERTNRSTFSLGVGVTDVTTAFDAVPPNVPTKLATNRSRFSGATYTCVESYWGPTAKFELDSVRWVCAAADIPAAGANATLAAIRAARIDIKRIADSVRI